MTTFEESFGSELIKLGKDLPYRALAGIGAGTGAMLNLGARGKAAAGLDYHPERKGRTLGGDTAKGAIAAVAAGALMNLLTKGKVK